MNNKRQAFTLAEGATHVDMSNDTCKKCFTLAEVLITLGIIGVVAAITLPGLMTTIKDKVDSNRMTVIEKRLLQGLNMLNTQDNGLSVPYNSTEDFVRALSKHMKITTICAQGELKNCLPYDKINYEKDGQMKSVNVDDIKTANDLMMREEGFIDTAGFVMADGTPFIVSYNKKCHELDANESLADPDKPMKEITPCFAGVYDINGTKSPNKFGTKIVDDKTIATSDIKSINGAKIGNPCVLDFQLNGKKVCITTTAKYPSPISQADCDKYQSEMGITYCNQAVPADGVSRPDLWAGAMLECHKHGERLPSEDELTEIAKQLYGDNTLTNVYKDGLTWQNRSVATTLGIPDSASSFHLWSSSEDTSSYAYYRYFNSAYTGRYGYGRSSSNVRFVCVAK